MPKRRRKTWNGRVGRRCSPRISAPASVKISWDQLQLFEISYVYDRHGGIYVSKQQQTLCLQERHGPRRRVGGEDSEGGSGKASEKGSGGSSGGDRRNDSQSAKVIN
jgi:hypothetical protein